MSLATNTKIDDDITIMLNNGHTLECPAALLRTHFHYFETILDGGFAESFAHRIELSQVNPAAFLAIISYLKGKEPIEICDSTALEEVIDYLQMKIDSSTAQAIIVLHDPNVIRLQCIEQGWIEKETNRVVMIPFGKKKQSWRFWVLYCLCLDIMPHANEGEDQFTLTEKLSSLGDGVSLRRELIEFGLIERKDDGSDYWRPTYDVNLVRKGLDGIQRRVI